MATTRRKTLKTFNQLYLMPKDRKLRIQESMDKVFGRYVWDERAPRELPTRLAERQSRHLEQKTDQDWTNVWPAARTFAASVVPLPMRMGYVRDEWKKLQRPAYGNLELMKIPNFLHLTPKHVQKHCAAIKKFCTKFPEELLGNRSEAKAMRLDHFPVEMEYSDFVHQSTNIRDMRARVVTLRVKLNRLGLDTHAHNKFRQLVGDRYNETSDWVSISSDRCPTRQQNRDFCLYLLTALFHEANKFEDWEKTYIHELLGKKEAERQKREHSDLETSGRLLTDEDEYLQQPEEE